MSNLKRVVSRVGTYECDSCKSDVAVTRSFSFRIILVMASCLAFYLWYPTYKTGFAAMFIVLGFWEGFGSAGTALGFVNGSCKNENIDS